MKRSGKISVLVIVLLSINSVLSVNVFSQTSGDPISFYVEGRNALSIDDPYRAVDLFRSALRLNPAYADARLGMAEALFLLSEYEEADRELNEARPYASNKRELVLLEARILTALGNYDAASSIYDNLLSTRPHDADANRGLAEIYAITGQRELADEAFDRSLRYSPGDKRVLLQLVLLHDKARERTRAEAALHEALRLFPDNLAVRVQAAEHFALYDDWSAALNHLERAKSMMSGPEDTRYPKVGLLDAELSLRKGDPAAALIALKKLPDLSSSKVLYLLARAYRDLGDESQAQNMLHRLLNTRSEDEIARMFMEEYLVSTTGGYETQRSNAAEWHLKRGRAFEENFYFERAYNEYRRARLISKYDPDVWLAYVDIIRKLGFMEHYRDSLGAAMVDIPESRQEYSLIERRLELLDHSEKDSIADDWGITDPWIVVPAEWDVGVFVLKNTNSLPIHTGSQKTLALYLADLLDLHPDLAIPTDASGRNPEIRMAEDFTEAFREARERHDYFVLARFVETDRTFSASGELYLARTGELIGSFEELRTGQGKVSDSLHKLSESLSSTIPRIMQILAVDGERVLLNKGRWHRIGDEEPWIVLRAGTGRPAAVDGGLSYSAEDYLGSVIIERMSEPLSEGRYERSGNFDFIGAGDEVFLLPAPEFGDQGFSSPDPAFKAQLLAIP